MKIMLATYGSRGDVQPMIALTLALKSADHDVLLAGPPEKKEWAEKLGCPYLAFGKDVTAFVDSKKDAVSFGSWLDFMRLVQQSLELQLTQLPSLVKGCDLIISSSLMLGASTAAEFLKIPYRYILFTPQLIPSRFHPYPLIKTQNLPWWMNLCSWKAAAFIDKLNFTRIINRGRKRYGLQAVKNAWDHILGKNPVLACDKVIAEAPEDTAVETVQTGYFHLDWLEKLPDELEMFLRDGDKPIYAGFGSMPVKDQKKNIPLLMKAARSTGQRIIINAFWNTRHTEQSEKNVFFSSQIPHQKLFPRTKVIVHHGGAGTTATAARAGVPQIIVPHILDQYYHGRKVFQKGLGSRPIWRSGLTAERLIDALEIIFSNRQIHCNAQKAAASINPEETLQKTVGIIEASVSKDN